MKLKILLLVLLSMNTFAQQRPERWVYRVTRDNFTPDNELDMEPLVRFQNGQFQFNNKFRSQIDSLNVDSNGNQKYITNFTTDQNGKAIPSDKQPVALEINTSSAGGQVFKYIAPSRHNNQEAFDTGAVSSTYIRTNNSGMLEEETICVNARNSDEYLEFGQRS